MLRLALTLAWATTVSPARLELIQTEESHLLPHAATSTTGPIKVQAARKLAAAAATASLELNRESPADPAAKRVLVAPTAPSVAQNAAPTTTQRLLHPFRRMSVEMLAGGGAAQMQPMELLMPCSVIGMGLMGIVWTVYAFAQTTKGSSRDAQMASLTHATRKDIMEV